MSQNNQIAVTAAQLQMPTVSGVVNIPLAELDHMRAEHVKAVKMAQDLEARRMEVLIVMQQDKAHYSTDRNGRSAYQGTFPAETSRTYKNLDEVKEDIHRVELEKLEELIQKKTEAIETLRNKLYFTETALVETKSITNRLNSSNIQLTDENGKLNSSNEEFKIALDKANETMESQASELTKLKANYLELEHKKSFWSWM